ncbi:MAG: ABC transporter ATP-binding protein [Clostridia bacterium]|nr:ABC transporter ATP-binding protein [Clostridia bacterium]
MAILEAIDIIKQYKRAGHTVTALNRASITVNEGEFVAIMGVSGSGKSTFINICAGLDTPNAGSVMLGGRMITSLYGDELTQYRGKTVGFVFQSHKLIPHLTAYENIMLPLHAANREFYKHEERFKLLVDSLDIRNRLGHLPSELSGGQAQRVAIARALIHYPRILFADEPTGNLDRKNADEVISLMLELRDSLKQTMVVVTHDQKTADRADRVYYMEDGFLIEKRR